MRLEALLHLIEAEKTAVARASLEQPAGRDPFDYGRAIGFYAGLDAAKDIIIGLYAEADERDRHL